MIIAFINGKGGVGKTTVSLLIGATLRDAGHDAAIDDRDPQQSATDLAGNLGVPITKSAPLLLIDTAPRLDHLPTIEAIQTADLVILVSSPSPADLSTTVKTSVLIQQHRQHAPTRILFNSVQAGTRLARGVDELKDHLPFPSLNNHLVRRQAYQLATIQGWTELHAEAREELLKVALDILAIKK